MQSHPPRLSTGSVDVRVDDVVLRTLEKEGDPLSGLLDSAIDVAGLLDALGERLS